MNIKRSTENGKTRLIPQGRLDTISAPELEAVVREVLPETSELIFDLEELEYVSSAGLRVLLSAQKAMNAKGKMKVCHVNDTILEIFEVTGFSDILTIE